MAYKAKSLKAGKVKASSAQSASLDKLNSAIFKQNMYNQGIKDMQTQEKAYQGLQRDVSLLSQYSQMRSLNKESSLKEYDRYKNNFSSLIETGEYSNFTMPTFEEFYENRVLGTINGVELSPSDVASRNSILNIDKMNILKGK